MGDTPLECVADVDFATRVLGSKRLAVVLFSMEGVSDLKMSRIIGRIAPERGDNFEFFVAKLAECPTWAKRFGILATPVVLVFAGGNPVAQLVGLHPSDTVCSLLDRATSRPASELPVLGAKELGARVNVADGWGHAVTSGVIAGAVFGFALRKLGGPWVFIIPASAAGMFILNDNFRFSRGQKAFAIGLMLVVGLVGQEVLALAYSIRL